MQRVLSGFEKAFCLSQPPVPINFSLAVEFSAAVDAESLRRALKSIRQRYPMAFYRLVRGADGRDCFDSSQVPDIPLKVHTVTSPGEWQAIAAADLGTLFDLSQGPLLRATLIKSTSSIGDVLLLTSHHGSADGMSAIIFLKDLLTLLHNPATALTACPEPPDLLPRIPAKYRGSLPLKAQIAGMKSGLWMMKKLSGLGLRTTPADRLIDGRYPWQYTRLTSRALDREQTAQLATRCKEEEASIHSALCAAWLLARMQVLHETKSHRAISCPVNLRPYLNLGEPFGMYMSNTLVAADCTPGRELWQVAREIKSELQQNINSGKMYDWVLTMMGLMDSDSDSIRLAVPYFATGAVNYDFSISNLGRLDLHSPGLKAVYGPLVNTSEREITVGISTVADRMTMSLVYRDFFLDPNKAEMMADLAVSILSDRCK